MTLLRSLGSHFSLIELNGAILQDKILAMSFPTYFSRTVAGFLCGLYEPGPTFIGVRLIGSNVPLAIMFGSIVPRLVLPRLMAISLLTPSSFNFLFLSDSYIITC